ncbi:hypothetical protein [Kitasatospora sp. NPDC001683]
MAAAGSFDGSDGRRAVDELTALVAAPSGGGSSIDWGRVAIEYDHGLPDDYKEFMEVYGEGVFDNFLSVVPPIPEAYPNDLSATVKGVTDDAQFTGEEEGFSDPDLLIGWGLTTDSDLLCWYADGDDPNDWTTVLWRRHWSGPDAWMRFDCGMVDLLCRYVRQEIPQFWIPDLRYSGSRFNRSRDIRRYRGTGTDLWGPEPLAG